MGLPRSYTSAILNRLAKAGLAEASRQSTAPCAAGRGHRGKTGRGKRPLPSTSCSDGDNC